MDSRPAVFFSPESHQPPGLPVGVTFGVPVGVMVPPAVGETDGVAPGDPAPVGDGIAVLVGVGDT